jgi:hypothetical protein
MHKIYLDDVRTPKESDWTVVRNYDEFISKIQDIGDLSLIDVISLDHDLGETAMIEYYKNVSPNYTLDYGNIREKTGMDCTKWLVNYSMDSEQDLPLVVVHSANPIGSANMMGYINNYLMNSRKKQTCIRVQIPHTVNH